MATDTPTLRYILQFKVQKVADGVVDSQGNEKKIPIESKLEGVYLVSSTNKNFFEKNEESYINKSKQKKDFFEENNLEIDQSYYVILDQTNIKKICSIDKTDKSKLAKLTLKEIKGGDTEFLYNITDPSTLAEPDKIQYSGVGDGHPLEIVGDYQAKKGDQRFEVDGEKVIIPTEGGKPKGGRTKRRKYRKKRKSMSKSSRKSRRKTAKK